MIYDIHLLEVACQQHVPSSVSPALGITAANHLGLEERAKGHVKRGTCGHTCAAAVSPLYLAAKILV